MNDATTVSLRVSTPPSGVRIADRSLDALAATRRAEYEERLRAEGFQLATQGPIECLERALEAIEADREEMLTKLAEHAAQIGVEIAQELLRKELKEANYDIKAIVRSVLEETSVGGPHTLRVNPEDAAVLEEVSFRTGTVVEADPTVRRADVHLQTAQGVLVRDIDACLATIRENLHEAMYR